MLHLYVPEMKEPLYNEIKNKSPGKYGETFNKSYLPSGHPVSLKSAMNQKELVKKLFIEDWRRKGFSYETTFEGECYHLVKERERCRFHVEPNIGKSDFVEIT